MYSKLELVLVKVLFHVFVLLLSVLFLLANPQPLFFMLLSLFCCIVCLVLLLLIVATPTMSNYFPLLHSFHVLSFGFVAVFFIFFFSCPYLNSVPSDSLSQTASFPSASLHPSLNGVYSSLFSSLRSLRRSFTATSRPRFFSRKELAYLLIYFSLLLSGDVELNPGPSPPNNLSFATLNIRSASSVTSELDKPTVLRYFILCNSLDILLLTETWLSSDSPPSVVNSLTPAGYSLLHQPRSTGRGGGLAVIYRSCLSISDIALPVLSSFESLCFSFALPTQSLPFLVSIVLHLLLCLIFLVTSLSSSLIFALDLLLSLSLGTLISTLTT